MAERDLVPDEGPRWYVAHTYSGYENKVKVDIENTVKNRSNQQESDPRRAGEPLLRDLILQVVVPMYEDEDDDESDGDSDGYVEDAADKKKKKDKKKSLKKLFPGYVLVYMVMTSDTWYVVRNTRGVTGFVGPDSKPVPLTDDEVRKFGISTGDDDKDADVYTVPVSFDFAEGDTVIVTNSSFAGKTAKIKSINAGKKRVKVAIEDMLNFGLVELGFDEIKHFD